MTNSVERGTAYHERLLVDHVPSMLAYWDADLRCRYANRAYERWFGVDPDSLPGTSISDLLGPELFALNEPHIRAVLRGEEQLFERIIPGPGGIRRHSLANYIPDIVGGAVVGFMVLVTDVTKIKETEAALQTQLAALLAAQVQLRRLGAELEMAEDRERRQVARDLHDDIGQTLAAARIRLSALNNDASEAVRSVASEVDALIAAADRSTRSLATQLAPAVLYELGLLPALEWLGEGIEQRFGLKVKLVDDGRPKPLSQVARSILYRAARELLINVAKHAHTDAAVVETRRDADRIVMIVSDAGVGFDPARVAAASNRGLGLESVRERLSFVGGTAEFRSVPGDGSVAVLTAPLATDEAPLAERDQ